MKLVFATSNTHKAAEIGKLLPAGIELLTLKDLDPGTDIPETAETLEGNAILKADYLTEHFGYNCFADDTGLEVTALHGEPGVRSARYAGEHRSDPDNIAKLLDRLAGSNDRSAQFRTVIALNMDGEQYLFEGSVPGTIIDTPRGDQGFGYDPVFVPAGSNRTFAEMSMDEKNQLSHRSMALRKMLSFLHDRVK